MRASYNIKSSHEQFPLLPVLKIILGNERKTIMMPSANKLFPIKSDDNSSWSVPRLCLCLYRFPRLFILCSKNTVKRFSQSDQVGHQRRQKKKKKSHFTAGSTNKCEEIVWECIRGSMSNHNRGKWSQEGWSLNKSYLRDEIQGIFNSLAMFLTYKQKKGRNAPSFLV